MDQFWMDVGAALGNRNRFGWVAYRLCTLLSTKLRERGTIVCTYSWQLCLSGAGVTARTIASRSGARRLGSSGEYAVHDPYFISLARHRSGCRSARLSYTCLSWNKC
jgi:hypothetical protein